MRWIVLSIVLMTSLVAEDATMVRELKGAPPPPPTPGGVDQAQPPAAKAQPPTPASVPPQHRHEDHHSDSDDFWQTSVDSTVDSTVNATIQGSVDASSESSSASSEDVEAERANKRLMLEDYVRLNRSNLCREIVVGQGEVLQGLLDQVQLQHPALFVWYLQVALQKSETLPEVDALQAMIDQAVLEAGG